MKQRPSGAGRAMRLVSALAALVGCAEGNSLDPSEDDGAGAGVPATGSSAASGASNGSGAASVSAGSGSVSASATSSTSAASSSSTGGGQGGEGGGATGPNGTATKMIGAFGGVGSSSVIASVQDLVMSTAFGTPFLEQTAEPIGLAMTGNGTGVLVVRAMASGELRYALWMSGVWSPGFATELDPVAAGLTLKGAPSIVATSDSAHVAYRRDDDTLAYAKWQGAWVPSGEAIGAAPDASIGAASPAIAMDGNDPIVVYVGVDGELYDRTRASGVWQAPNAHGLAGDVAAIAPAVVAPVMGPELLVVFADSATNELWFSTRAGGAWSTPETIFGAVSNEPVSLAVLPGGGAALAWRAPDASLHAAVFDPSASPAWVEPSGLPPSSVAGPPAVATGAMGARAELLWVDQSTNLAYSTRLVGDAWLGAALAGSSGERVALATGD